MWNCKNFSAHEWSAKNVMSCSGVKSCFLTRKRWNTRLRLECFTLVSLVKKQLTLHPCIKNNYFLILNKWQFNFLFAVEELAEKYAAKGQVAPMNVLWVYHFSEGNAEASERIWTKYLTKTPRLMFQRIVHVAREKQDEIS